LDYCSFAYSNASVTNLKKIDTIQYKSLLLVVGGMKGTALNALLGECAEIPMDLRRKKILLKYLLKLHNNPNNSAFDILKDKKFHQLQLNNKSIYSQILTSFLQENNIVLKSGSIPYSDYPWPVCDVNVDISKLKDLPLAKNDQNIVNTNTTSLVIAQLKATYKNIIYVDGSVREEGKAGGAILCPEIDLKRCFRLPNGMSIYFAEAFAILNGIRAAAEKNCKSFVIISDNLRVIEDIMSSNYTLSPHPSIIYQIRLELLQRGSNSYLIKWLTKDKLHNNLHQVDSLAKTAVSSNKIDSIDFTDKEAILMIDDWIWKLWTDKWMKNISCNYQGIFPLSKKPLVWNIPRHQEIIINRLRLQQSKLKAGLYKIGLHETGFCDHCGIIETTQHFIMECETTAPIRNHLELFFTRTNKVWSLQAVLNDIYCMTYISKYISLHKITI